MLKKILTDIVIAVQFFFIYRSGNAKKDIYLDITMMMTGSCRENYYIG